jgi:IclR family KDG regulon transcriptional repressor
MERSIKSAERTLRLFELFSLRPKRLSVTDVVDGLAMPQPSASMLLSNLARMGYLEHDRLDRTYAPTIRVALLGCGVGTFTGGPSLASQLDHLHAAVGEDCLISIQNGACTQIVYARGQDILRIDSGRLYPLTYTAMGQALLALKPESEASALVRRCNAEAENDLTVQGTAFMAHLGEVRRMGYAVTTEYLRRGRIGVAVAVQPQPSSIPFGIGFAGPVDRMEAKHDLVVAQLLAFKAAQESAGDHPLAEGWELAPA